MNKRELVAWIAVLVLAVMFARKDVEIVEIQLPVRTNTKVITNPAPIADNNTKIITHFETLKVINPANDSLIKAHLRLRDSLSRLNNFIEVTKQRDYVELLEDSLQVITVETRVRGFMQEQIIKYKTKPQTVKIKVKNGRKGLYAGGFITMPQQTGLNPSLGGAINIVSPKKVFTLGYDTNKTLSAGVTFKIF